MIDSHHLMVVFLLCALFLGWSKQEGKFHSVYVSNGKTKTNSKNRTEDSGRCFDWLVSRINLSAVLVWKGWLDSWRARLILRYGFCARSSWDRPQRDEVCLSLSLSWIWFLRYCHALNQCDGWRQLIEPHAASHQCKHCCAQCRALLCRHKQTRDFISRSFVLTQQHYLFS